MTTHGPADLHLHTVASDGTVTVDEQVRRAKAAALACIAITDHDVVSSDITARVCRLHGLEVIAGVEIKADFDGVTGEMLGYFFDPRNEELRAFLEGMGKARIERMEEMIRRCREELKIEIDLSDVGAVADGNLGRPHLARVLVNKGVAADFPEAFNKLLKRGAPCYAPIEKDDFRDVVALVHRAGGVTSLAHPCLMRVSDWAGFLDEAAAAGVDGLETYYPYDPSSRGLTIEPRLLRTMAEKRGLLLTGGSDDHGPDSTKESIGTVRVPYERVEALRAALPIPL
jgi:predicted metal-dependent phosphoesterase TrpH